MKSNYVVLSELIAKYSVWTAIHVWAAHIMFVEVRIADNPFWIIAGEHIATVYDNYGYVLESFNNTKDFERVMNTLFASEHKLHQWKEDINVNS